MASSAGHSIAVCSSSSSFKLGIVTGLYANYIGKKGSVLAEEERVHDDDDDERANHIIIIRSVFMKYCI